MRVLFLSLQVFILNFALHAQNTVYHFSHLSVQQGLTSGTTNNYVFTDSENFVWISSNAGLNCYDGHRIKSYHQDNDRDNSLIREVASQSNIYEDKNSDLWFAGGSAVTCYRRKTDDFINYRLLDELGGEIVERYKWSYLNNTGDTLLFSSQSELYYLAIDRPTEHFLVDSTRLGYKDFMLETEKGTYRLVQFRPGGKLITIKDLNPVKGVRSVVELPSEYKIYDVIQQKGGTVLYAGTERGLMVYDLKENTWDIPEGMRKLADYRIMEVEMFGEQLVVGTEKDGIFIANLSGAKPPAIMYWVEAGELRPFVQNISRLSLDRRANLYVSTLDNGVFHTNLKAPKMQTFFDAVRQQPVIDVEHWDDTTRLILYQGKLEVITPAGIKEHQLPFAGQEFELPTFLTVDSRKRIFVGTYDKLFMADELVDPEWRPVHLSPSGPYSFGPGYNDLHELSDGNYLVGLNVERPAIVGPDFSNPKWFTNNVARPRKFAIGNQQVLVATYADTLHLLKYNASHNSVITLAQFMELPSVNDLYYDGIHQCFWVATMKGLYVLTDNNGIYTIKLDEVIGEKPVFSVGGSGLGELYIGGADGISRYSPTQREVFTYTTSDGIQGFEFAAHALSVSRDNVVLIGGYNGANLINPATPVTLSEPPRINLVGAYIRDREVPVGDLANLRFTENDLRFDFMDGDLVEPTEVAYRFRLSTPDGEQQFRDAEGASVYFANLASASYTLDVTAVNSDGVEAADVYSLQFTILPPWYRTWWAYTLYILTALGIISGYFWQILNREREKSARAQAEALAAETETSVLRLQMNPHFIFNSLNAVNAYILKGDKLKAHEYLVRFADLIREILNRSARPLTRLDLAIELLEDYLEAERMRVGEKLTYAIEVDEEMDTFTTYLPTMILQPFVENAIWHGISGLAEGGHITLRFMPDEGERMLRVEVEDNGRGRSATAKGAQRHKSMAMDITRRRLEILNQSIALSSHVSAPASAPGNARYEIIDLKHPDGIAAGTRVVLYLPREYPPEDARSSD